MINEKNIMEALQLLKEYKSAKSTLDARIVENEKWFRLKQFDVFRQKKETEEPESAWLFSALASKHADVMDSYPEPSILPRARDDMEEAARLSAILPVILERCDFEESYSDAWWYKLKNGVCAYGVFWDGALDGGVGDISVRSLDLLNIYLEPGISDVQRSASLFLIDFLPRELLELKEDKVGTDQSLSPLTYEPLAVDQNKVAVVDWYYKKKNGAGKQVVHYCKFACGQVLYASENDPIYAEKGFYDHGRYPIVFDVLFPLEGSVYGMGYIDICKGTQEYIDRLNQIILKNALQTGKKRFFIKDTGGVNEEEFGAWDQDFVHVAGSIGEENIREIVVSPLDGYIMSMLQVKVNELKETSGNRDVSNGGVSGGVTAASAIAALQEAGGKLSRDMIRGSYRAFCGVNVLMIELIRQFYDASRSFRLSPEGDFMTYNNTGLKEYSQPVFDIKVRAQKASPYSRIAQNELAKELYNAGFFEEKRRESALMALDMMDFEGKAQVIAKIMVQKERSTEGNEQSTERNGQSTEEEGGGKGR